MKAQRRLPSARKALVLLTALFLLGGAYVVYHANIEQGPTTPEAPLVEIPRKVTAEDHMLGNIDAPVQAIVYTDLECPYCKRFYDKTLPALRQKFGDELLIVYRHYPLPSRPQGIPEAEAAECVYTVGGDDAFWKFVDGVFAITPSNNAFDLALLSEVAVKSGVDKTAFKSCQRGTASGARVRADMKDGALVGVVLTPSIVLRRGHESVLVSGDYPARVEAAIEYLRSKESELPQM